MGDWWLISAFAPLLGIAVFLWFSKKKRKGGLFISTEKFFSEIPSDLRATLSPLPLILKFTGLALIIVALARPRTVSERSEQNVKGIDIMIVLDISLSMLVEDMGLRVTRLKAAKAVVSEFVKGRISDRIGLIVFSGESYTRVPLTLDYDILLENLSRVSVVSASQIRQGTAIGVALTNASARLRGSSAESRVVVFLTDGDNNAGSIDPLTAMKIAKKENVKVYTIGVGQKSGQAPIRYETADSFGIKRTQIMYVTTRINKKLLKQMAQGTGGKFFMARNLSGLRSIFSEIDNLEKQKITIDKWTEYREKFADYLKPGIILYALALLLSLTVFFRGV